MVIDTSALIAVLFDEAERATFVDLLAADPRRLVSAGTLLELGLVVEARRGEAAGRELDLLLHRLGVTVVPVDEAQVRVARSGWRRFGKGRHAAGLNLGDCFSYALSRLTGEPLLFKGDDFRLTDVAAVR